MLNGSQREPRPTRRWGLDYQDLISRAGPLYKIRPLEQKAGPFIDFPGEETWATPCIKLIWFPNQSSKTN